jgi:hypothetical protein
LNVALVLSTENELIHSKKKKVIESFARLRNRLAQVFYKIMSVLGKNNICQ